MNQEKINSLKQSYIDYYNVYSKHRNFGAKPREDLEDALRRTRDYYEMLKKQGKSTDGCIIKIYAMEAALKAIYEEKTEK